MGGVVHLIPVGDVNDLVDRGPAPADHPIRRIRVIVDSVLAELDDTFDQMYAGTGRSSVPPESLLKATILMAMYSIRSERAFRKRLTYDWLIKWFLDLRIDQPAFDASKVSRPSLPTYTEDLDHFCPFYFAATYVTASVA